MRGEQRGSNGSLSTFHRVSITPCATHNQTGPLWCWFPSGWACACSRPRGSLQGALLCGWEFLLLQSQPPWVFSLRGLRLYFPALEPWGAWSASLPTVCLVYLCTNVGLRGLLPTGLPALFSTTLSPALLVYLCVTVGPQGLLVVRLSAPFVPFVPHSASLGPTRAI